MDITTNDGTIYKDVQVLESTPITLDITYKTKKGVIVKSIKFTQLSKELQQKYKYSAKTAAAFTQKIKLYKKKQLAEAYKLALANDKLQKDINGKTAKIKELKAMIYAKRIKNVQLNVIRVATNGVVAYCKAARPDAHSLLTGNDGKVFILNHNISSGDQWWGNLYPVNQTVSLNDGIFPVYTISLDKAVAVVLKQK